MLGRRRLEAHLPVHPAMAIDLSREAIARKIYAPVALKEHMSKRIAECLMYAHKENFLALGGVAFKSSHMR